VGTVSCAFVFAFSDPGGALAEVHGNLITPEHMVSMDGENWISAQEASMTPGAGRKPNDPISSSSPDSTKGLVIEVRSLHLVGGGSIRLAGGVIAATLGSRTSEQSPGIYHLSYSGRDLGSLDSLQGAASGIIHCRAGAVLALHDGVPQIDINLISAPASHHRLFSQYDAVLMVLKATHAPRR